VVSNGENLNTKWCEIEQWGRRRGCTYGDVLGGDPDAVGERGDLRRVQQRRRRGGGESGWKVEARQRDVQRREALRVGRRAPPAGETAEPPHCASSPAAAAAGLRPVCFPRPLVGETGEFRGLCYV
jgi:hypothetical protein